MELYIVRFIRRDAEPIEEYYYRSLSAAEDHLEMFRDDDSELYSKIEVLRAGKDVDTKLKEICYAY